LGQFVALKGLSTTESDSICGYYVAQCVVLASDRVVQSVYEGVDDPSFTANIAANKPHIRRNRAYQFVLGVGLRVLWGFTRNCIL
jgi:hypothetical protein